MSRDLEHFLNATAVEPSRPIDLSDLARRIRKRRLRRHSTALASVVAVVGLVAVVTAPGATSGSGDTVASPSDPPVATAESPEVTDAAPSLPPAATPLHPGEQCPVTIPPVPGFVPPDGYPTAPTNADRVWYGTDGLWTDLPLEGAIGAGGKTPWWSVNFGGGSVESEPRLFVTWERLDADADPISNGGHATNAYTPESGWVMLTGGREIPTAPGCWQVTATYKGAELSYVYEIVCEPDVYYDPPCAGDMSSNVDTADQTDLALADTFVAFATKPSSATAALLPFTDVVTLGLGPDLLLERTAAELGDPSAWVIEQDVFRAYTGPFSVLDPIRRHVTGQLPDGLQLATTTKVEVGDYTYCAGSPLPPPADAVKNLRRISIQPADDSVISWLSLFYVDLYVDDAGRIKAVTLDLCEP